MKIKLLAITGLCSFLLTTAFLGNAQETGSSTASQNSVKKRGDQLSHHYNTGNLDTIKTLKNGFGVKPDTIKAKVLSVKGWKVFKNEKGEILDTQVAIKMLLGNTYIAVRKVDKEGKEYISVEEPPVEN